MNHGIIDIGNDRKSSGFFSFRFACLPTSLEVDSALVASGSDKPPSSSELASCRRLNSPVPFKYIWVHSLAQKYCDLAVGEHNGLPKSLGSRGKPRSPQPRSQPTRLSKATNSYPGGLSPKQEQTSSSCFTEVTTSEKCNLAIKGTLIGSLSSFTCNEHDSAIK